MTGKGVWLIVIFECENPTQNDLMIGLGLLWLTCMRFGWRHFLIQPLRQSEKWIRALVLFVSLLSLGFRFSIFIKCWDPYVNPGCKVQLGFCGGLYFLPQELILSLSLIELGSNSIVLPLLALDSAKAVWYNMLGVWSWVFVFSWLILGRWNWSFCIRQGMLT